MLRVDAESSESEVQRRNRRIEEQLRYILEMHRTIIPEQNEVLKNLPFVREFHFVPVNGALVGPCELNPHYRHSEPNEQNNDNVRASDPNNNIRCGPDVIIELSSDEEVEDNNCKETEKVDMVELSSDEEQVSENIAAREARKRKGKGKVLSPSGWGSHATPSNKEDDKRNVINEVGRGCKGDKSILELVSRAAKVLKSDEKVASGGDFLEKAVENGLVIPKPSWWK